MEVPHVRWGAEPDRFAPPAGLGQAGDPLHVASEALASASLSTPPVTRAPRRLAVPPAIESLGRERRE